MRNDSVAQKGQKLVENYFKKHGWEVDDVTERDNTLPYDIAVRKKPGGRWMKIQVKTTRGPKDGAFIFRTRKSKGGKKVLYEPTDLHMFVFVDAKSKTIVSSAYSKKGCFSFSQDVWEGKCTRA